MHKKKKSRKRKLSLIGYPSLPLKKGIKTSPFDPSKELGDYNLVATAFFEALQDDDVEGALEILEGYLMTKKKADLAKRGRIATSTLYQSLSKRANPTLKTVAKILHAA